MEDFEQAVESGTLPTFLKQDQTASSTTGEGELEKLMREMTNSDLDKLVGELGVEDGESSTNIGKVGLIVPEDETEKEVVGRRTGHGLSLGLTESGDSKEEVGEALRSATTVDELIAANEKAVGKEKVD